MDGEAVPFLEPATRTADEVVNAFGGTTPHPLSLSMNRGVGVGCAKVFKSASSPPALSSIGNGGEGDLQDLAIKMCASESASGVHGFNGRTFG